MKPWQAHLGSWGTLAWFGSFQAGEFLKQNNHHNLMLAIFGYTMGYVTVFTGHLFWGRIVNGRWDELLGEGTFSKIDSAICLTGIMFLGILGAYISIFRANPWFYSLFFAIGGLVVNQGLMPIIDYVDGDKRNHG